MPRFNTLYTATHTARSLRRCFGPDVVVFAEMPDGLVSVDDDARVMHATLELPLLTDPEGNTYTLAPSVRAAFAAVRRTGKRPVRTR